MMIGFNKHKTLASAAGALTENVEGKIVIKIDQALKGASQLHDLYAVPRKSVSQ
jgi:hypothetical protein